MNVMPTSVWIRLSSICIARRSLRSSAPSGSSRSRTSGQLGGALAGLRLELDELEHRLHLVVDVGLLLTSQPERDVLEDVEVGEQRVVLEDRVHRPAVGLVVGDLASREPDRPGRRGLEARHHPQRRGLAAPGRAEEGEEGPRGYVEIEVVDRGERRELLGQTTELQAPARLLGARRLRLGLLSQL
jgi:hypothetical protein